MRKKKESLDKPRIKGLRVLCIGVAAVWLIASFGVYRESKREKYDLSVRPGAVTYGTHSSPVIPMVSVSKQRTAIPMISGSEVRSYARYGHASMPSMSSGGDYGIYTTSSATTHAGSTGGGAMGSSGGGSTLSTSAASQRSGGFTVSSMLSMLSGSATANTSMSSITVTPSNLATTSLFRNVGPRRVNPHAGETGSEGDKYQDTEDPNLWWYWSEAAEDWVSGNPPIGTVKEEGGIYYEWDGTGWVVKGQVSDLGTPVGDTPWLIMMLLAVAYVLKRKKIIFDNIGNF